MKRTLILSFPWASSFAQDRLTGRNFATRSEVVKRNGGFKSATCDPNWFGYFKKGGTAVDAAIAVNAALGLMEPWSWWSSLRLYGMLKRKNCMD
jgi:gamma-glutamyltranspeptidase/glutathione hydrolase